MIFYEVFSYVIFKILFSPVIEINENFLIDKFAQFAWCSRVGTVKSREVDMGW